MSDIETRFRVDFSSSAGAGRAEAGRCRVTHHNVSRLEDVSNIFPGVEIFRQESNESVAVYGLHDIRALRDLCDRYLKTYNFEGDTTNG